MLFKSWLGSGRIGMRALCVCALSLLTLLLGACTVTSTSGGTLQVSWTVNGLTDPNQCAAIGAQSVSITLTDANGLQSGSSIVSCSSLSTSFSGLSTGAYNVAADLLDASGNVLLTSTSGVNVTDGATSQDIIPWNQSAAGTSSLTVTWTVAGSAAATACASANATSIQINLYNSANALVQSPLLSCVTGTDTIANLPADTYSLTAQLLDSTGAAATTAASTSGIIVSSGANTTQDVDFPSSSFETGTPGTGTGTGSIAVSWTVDGGTATASCGNHNAASIEIQLYQTDGVTAVGSPILYSCVAYQAVITGVAAGSYTIGAQMVNSTTAVSTQSPIVPITVTDGGTAQQVFVFPTSSFTQ